MLPAPDAPVVLTTGCNSGIGLEIALEVARRGWRSIGTVRTQDAANIVERAAADNGVRVDTVLLDVTDRPTCHELMAQMPPLMGLVNNAGYNAIGAITDMSDEAAAHAIECMAIAPMRLARLALPCMIEAGGGTIVNISSAGARFTQPLAGWYHASKHALEAATDALRVEVLGRGVHVVLIEPGGFRTDIVSGQIGPGEGDASGMPSEFAAGYRRIGRLVERGMRGDPRVVARLVARVLATERPRARYLVGADARVLTAVGALPAGVTDRLWRRLFGL